MRVLVGACADRTLYLSTLCASSQNSPAGNTVLYHLRTKFEPEQQLERVITLLRKDLDELLPERVEVCADLHLPATTVTKTTHRRPLSLGSEAWNHCVPRLYPLYARVKNKRYTLAVRRLKDGDTAKWCPR